MKSDDFGVVPLPTILRTVWRSATVFSWVVLSPVALAGEVAFGYIPASPAQFSSQPEVPRYRAFLPAKVDLSRYFPTPGTQGMMNSCTGWAVGYAARSYYSLRSEGRDVTQPRNVASPNYIYQSIRVPDNCASGALLLDSFRLLQKGSLSFAQYPVESCARPSEAQRHLANQFRIKDWLAVRPQYLDDVKGQVAKGNPVVIGMEVAEDIANLQKGEVYRGGGKTAGFHAMTVVGYDDEKQAFKIINSWGTRWADDGFGWIDYGAFRNYVREAYIIRLGSAPAVSSEDPVPVAPIDRERNDQVVEVISPHVLVKPKPKPDHSVSDDIDSPIERPVIASDCSNVFAESVGDRIELSGYVPTEADIKLIERSNKGRPLDIKLDVRPWPQCEVLTTLGTLLNKPGAPKISTKSGRTVFSDGEVMVFEVVAPKTPSYLYVSYVQADGKVLTLWQPESDLSPTKSGQRLTFGGGDAVSPKFRVSKPYGIETLLVVASDSPLFDSPLPAEITEREYLSRLRRAVLYRADPLKPDRNLSAAFLGVETKK